MRTQLRCILHVATIVGLLVFAASLEAQTATHFNLPAQPLADALRAVGTLTNTSVVFEPSLVAGRRAPAIDARLSLNEALGRLLDGTGLTHRFLNERTVVLAVTPAKTTVREARADERIVIAQAALSNSSASNVQSAPASGRDAPTAEAPPGEMQEVVVTGSLLKVDNEDALPVTTLDAEELARAGATNAMEALQLIAQNQFTTISNTSIGSGTGFASYASLRSLGSARTLVLVNGKRMVNNPYQSLGVDLNTIPTALIDRVEVLTDGASSTYGSDAIAGVINFVMRTELTGALASATATQPEAGGGGETYLANFGGGVGSLAEHGWNVHMGATWRKFEELRNVSREFARTTYVPERGFSRLNSTTFPANYSQQASGLTAVNPSNPQCQPPVSLSGGGVFGPRSCAFDFAPSLSAIPPQEQWSLVAKASKAFGSHVASLEYVRAHSELVSAISSKPLTGLTMTSVNPFYPGQGITPGVTGLNPALPISLNWRMEVIGLSTTRVRSETDRIVAQLAGSLAGWDYQLSALESNAWLTLAAIDGTVNDQDVRNGLVGAAGAPFLNPFGEQTDAGLQFLRDSRVVGEAQRADGRLRSYGVQATRDVMSLPAGELSLALAAEYKEEESELVNNFDLIREAGGFGGLDLAQDTRGERHSLSLAVEASVPVTQALELGLALRYDDYSDFGDTTNPKITLRYQPIDAVLLRGSYNTGFRAATLYDLYSPARLSTGRNRNFDPVLCPGGVPNFAAGAVPTRDCNFQFNVRSSGNPNLEAEESHAFSVGILLQPLRNLSFGVDYWYYDVTQTIGVLAETAIFADTAKYGHLIARCSEISSEERAVIDACRIPGGDPIAYIENATSNLGDSRTSGFDITAEWTAPETLLGRFALNYRGTYVSRYEFQRELDGPFFSRNGVYFDGLPLIRYTHHASLKWERDAWALRLANRRKAGYEDCNAQCNVAPQFFNEVGSYSLWDLAGTYQGLQGVSITIGVTNLLDTEPPFTNKTAGLGSGWDERFTDPLGRTYSLILRYEL